MTSSSAAAELNVAFNDVNIASKKLVLFDFDGTITTHDTLAEFMIYYHGKLKYLSGLALLSPVLAMYVTKTIPNWKAKEYFLKWYLKGEDIIRFNEKCMEFTMKKIDSLIRPQALEAIKRYKSEGATVAVVSASAENWVKPWCDKHGLICLGTKLEVKNNKITGNLTGKNCYGAEKVCRIKERFTLTEYNEVIAYGDTSGDKEMLALAHKQFYKPFRD
ncbi:HAD-IB family hydrolase [Chryseosolibacter indicus]|uniref:HAD-IB family hydrolase n=1 Tax=Chryseosolibacter indicus TaxID=2782351 RepID=A0ABS5VSY2_9BACT|nr:HAD-IB family hydrolase [Chryseosolibacter indicus]MBT1704466.1 HAD-IB family hydrolase [Chryseosolibacter indicus]